MDIQLLLQAFSLYLEENRQALPHLLGHAKDIGTSDFGRRV